MNNTNNSRTNYKSRIHTTIEIKETTNYSVQKSRNCIVEDNETMLLEYFLGKNTSYVWAITRNGARVYELPKADVITEAVGVVMNSSPETRRTKQKNVLVKRATTWQTWFLLHWPISRTLSE